MGTTNMLLREILQEIREVKTHVIPQSVLVSPPSVTSQVPILDPAYVVAEPAIKGVYKGKPRWQHTNTESYIYEFPALSSVARLSAGGGGPLNRESGLKYGGFRSKIFLEQPTQKWHGQIGTQASAGGAAGGAGGGGEEDENENCPADSLPGTAIAPFNASRNGRLMGRMSKEEVAGLSKEDKKRRNELKKLACKERKASRPPEEQAKIDAKVAKMQAARSAGKGAQDFRTAMSGWTAEELEAVRSSLRGPVAKPGEERQTRKRKNRRNRTRKN